MAEETGNQNDSVLDWAASIVGKAYDAVLDGGRIEAATMQGFSELGNALQAFPDSIMVEPAMPAAVEPPAVGLEVSVEVSSPLPSPAELASLGSIHGDTQAPSIQPPSPAEIASQEVTPAMTGGMEMEQPYGKTI